MIEILAKKADRFFVQDLQHYIHEVIGSNIRVWNTLENHKEMIEAIERTNESLLSYKISNIVKILTLLSFIIFPLSLLTAIFSMNTLTNYKLIQNIYAFWLILAAMIIIALGIFLYFKKKKWL